MNILVTGCAGFIGSNFVKLILKKHPEWRMVNLDALTYAGQGNNLIEEEKLPNYFLYPGDIAQAQDVKGALETLGKCDAIVNFAAESHVDNSIKNPGIFVQTNVQGTVNLLNFARDLGVRYLQVSTDEVYGSLGPEGYFTEETGLAPNSPYSASKTAADCMVRAWCETFGLDAVITRCSNNYGPYQFPEKLIPLAISNLMQGKKIPVYGKGTNIRDWLHVEDHCEGILLALLKGVKGEVYNIGGFNEWTNIDIAHKLCEIMGKDPEKSIEFVTDRLGHDLRYAIDSTKITRELGWKPKYHFESGIKETVDWYVNNTQWWEPLKKGIQ